MRERISRLFFASPLLTAVVLGFIPGLCAFLTYLFKGLSEIESGTFSHSAVVATGMFPASDLVSPLHQLLLRWVGGFASDGLIFPLTLCSALIAMIAVTLFYWVIVRIVFLFCREMDGGELNVSLDYYDDEEETDERTSRGGQNSAEASSFSESHLRFVSIAAWIAGLIGAFVLAFSPPFWGAVVRCAPVVFDLMLFFCIVNLFLGYFLGGAHWRFYVSLFLTAFLISESILFILLIPIVLIAFFLYLSRRNAITLSRMSFALFLLGAGVVLSILAVREFAFSFLSPEAAKHLGMLWWEARRHVVVAVMMNERFLHFFLFLIVPCLLVAVLFPRSFFRRRNFLFVLQVLLLVLLFLPLWQFDQFWGSAPTTVFGPEVASTALCVLFLALVLASWLYAAEANALRKLGLVRSLDEEVEIGEFDRKWISTVAPIIAVFFSVVCLFTPFRNVGSLRLKDSKESDLLIQEMCRNIRPDDVIARTGNLDMNLFFALREKKMNFVFFRSDDDPEQPVSNVDRAMVLSIADRDVDSPLVNAMDLSYLMAWREMLNMETGSVSRLVFSSPPAKFHPAGYELVQDGLFVRFQKAGKTFDADLVYRNYLEQANRLFACSPQKQTSLSPASQEIRSSIFSRFALIGNELAGRVAQAGNRKICQDLLEVALRLDPNHPLLLLNAYALSDDAGRLALIDRIYEIPSRFNLLSLTKRKLEQDYGTLFDERIISQLRREVWMPALSLDAVRKMIERPGASRQVLLGDVEFDLQQKIRVLIDSNDFPYAQELTDILLDLNPDNAFALQSKAQLLLLDGKLEDAERWLEKARKADVKESDLVWHSVKRLLLLDKHQEARTLINREISNQVANPYLWGLLADLLLEENNFDQLRIRVYPSLQHASEKHPYYQFFKLRGLLSEKEGRIMSARRDYLRALELNPYQPELERRLLRIDMQEGAALNTAEDAKRVLRKNPRHPDALTLWGLTRLREQKFALGLDLLNRALAFRQDDAFTYIGIAVANRGLGRPNEGRAALDKALALNPKSAYAHYQYALFALDRGQVEESDGWIKKALAIRRNDPDFLLHQAKIFLLQGKMVQLSRILQEVRQYENVFTTKQRVRYQDFLLRLNR